MVVIFIFLCFESVLMVAIIVPIIFMGPFELTYFRAYIKQLMQINKFLCIIYKFLRLFMKKQFIKVRFSLVRAYKLK